MGKKLTIAEKLAKRRYKPAPKFIAWIYKFIMVDIIGRKYKPHFNIIDDVNDCKGPCFVIFNHLSRIDHLYVMGATYPRVTNMMAAYNEFYRKKFSFVFGLDKVIPKKNYSIDRLYIRGISDVFKKNGCVTFAPEGLASDYGGNKPIVPGTSKLFKHFKVPVYLCYLEGQYLQNTKVCFDERLGETFATMSLLFSKEDVEKMSVEEMDDIMPEDLGEEVEAVIGDFEKAGYSEVDEDALLMDALGFGNDDDSVEDDDDDDLDSYLTADLGDFEDEDEDF